MAGVLVVIVLAVLATLVILCKKRKGWFMLHSKVKSRDRADAQHFFHNLENPLYSGELQCHQTIGFPILLIWLVHNTLRDMLTEMQ